MALDFLSGVTEMAWDVLSWMKKLHGMFCPGWQISVRCFVRVSKNGMRRLFPGCYVLHSVKPNKTIIKDVVKALFIYIYI